MSDIHFWGGRGEREMKKIATRVAFFCSILFVALSAFAEGHLELSRAFLDGLKNENNQYMHNGFMHWRGERGFIFTYTENEARIDCSGFVNEILKKAKSKTYDLVYRNTSWKKYPKAESYYEAIINGYGFTQREFADTQPGDILAIKFESTALDTGHVMFVDAVPVKIEPREPIIRGTLQWKVVIIDASGAHGEDDTRYVDGKRYTGVGRGSYRIYTDETGKIVGHTSGLKRKPYYPIEFRPIALGTPL